MKRKVISGLLVLLLLISMPLGASQISNKKEELNDTKKEMQQTQNQLKANESQKKQAEEEIAKLDREIIQAEEQVAKVETQLEEKTAQVKQAEVELGAAIEKKDYQYEATKKRMVQMYKNGKSGYMELVFSSGSLSELLSRAQYIKVISEYDNQLLDEYREQERVIAEHKAILAEEEVQLSKLHKEQVTMKESLEAKRAEKNKRIKALNQEANELEAELKAMEAEYKKIEEEIKRLTANSTIKYNGGKFTWPVPGHYGVSSDYYNRINPVTNKAEFHKGIDIPAPYGKSVVAAADGKVIYSGRRGTFGNTVIIDHGSGLTTLYAHNSSLTVSEGTMVKKGQQIAKIGSTGRSTGNHSHFEVRINNAHTSPWNYLSK